MISQLSKSIPGHLSSIAVPEHAPRFLTAVPLTKPEPRRAPLSRIQSPLIMLDRIIRGRELFSNTINSRQVVKYMHDGRHLAETVGPISYFFPSFASARQLKRLVAPGAADPHLCV